MVGYICILKCIRLQKYTYLSIFNFKFGIKLLIRQTIGKLIHMVGIFVIKLIIRQTIGKIIHMVGIR